MQKALAQDLQKFAEEVARRFSHTARDCNYSGCEFTVKQIIPTSEDTAAVYFEKTQGKSALAFFYYLAKGKSKGWRYFFPTDGHINGFRAFDVHKIMIEQANYKFNFD